MCQKLFRNRGREEALEYFFCRVINNAIYDANVLTNVSTFYKTCLVFGDELR